MGVKLGDITECLYISGNDLVEEKLMLQEKGRIIEKPSLGVARRGGSQCLPEGLPMKQEAEHSPGHRHRE